ncbi:Trp biosynthesis-associated membrane protein [Microbacterium dextranolyticum]|uniref:Peptidase n=1 Tax=Microbacterium dextranolyticum TaxID=36806 RepID=A0A9W6M6T6_9MICO|nr:Trp biosynthesis-associated membrane protein [Microbacterium dextranolyticum]MBM7463072.1 putative membrane protein (TIGR02234 family) [Microbacterium dextranolyticum]GLJ95823.1 hypothetical protein GCM10017591_18860 [Microbacterium dextranolyticum]
MIARARMIAVLGIVLGGAVGVISSTQTWLEVALRSGSADALAVPGASAMALLAPLSLAALALGLALTVVGRVLRYAFGVLAAAIGVTMLAGSARIAFERPVDAAASVVTSATGLSGRDAIADLVEAIAATAWPFAAAVAGLVILAGGLWTLATAHRWRGSGRRYERETSAPTARGGARPHDASRDNAIDSWDDLSHGDDPTDR